MLMRSLIFVAVLVLTLTLWPGTAAVGQETYRVTGNPVIPRAADPHAAVMGRRVFVYPTHGGGRFEVWSSSNLTDWTSHGTILDFADVPWLEQGTSNAWAPAIHESRGRYYFYYSVGGNPSRIGVAGARSPLGPFTDSGRMLIDDNTGNPDRQFEAIDPMVYYDPASRRTYLYAGGSRGSTLRIWELNDDLISLGEEVDIEQPPSFTEGAFMHERNGIYYLSYSHGSYRDHTYSVHYCTSDSPVGPWTYRGCILESNEQDKGPGHHSFVSTGRDQWYIVYHRWEDREGDGPYRGGRSTAIDEVVYDEAGLIEPIVMTSGPPTRRR